MIARTLYLPTGPRFSGHSHIKDDLRVMWDVYTLYDSAPSFLSAEQREAVMHAGPPNFRTIEALTPGRACTEDVTPPGARAASHHVLCISEIAGVSFHHQSLLSARRAITASDLIESNEVALEVEDSAGNAFSVVLQRGHDP